jgi:phthiocerol/phenolphthiocerol synthesis type-I polyketide synthase E
VADVLAERIASLSGERRKLLEELLRSKEAPKPVPVEHNVAPLSFENGASANEVKANYRRFFNEVNRQLNSTDFGPFSFFLNFGYVANLNPQFTQVELPDHYLNKNSVRLVLETIGDCDLADRRVLDVGCGRGGIVYVLQQFFRPRSVNAIDLSPEAIAFCRANHCYSNVSFEEGDAEHLPFPDESFDAVTNVESSHSYPNVFAFYAEVFRVLRPGGCILYTDVFPAESRTDRVDYLTSIGFGIERDTDITTNVLLSCDEIARSRIGAYDSNNDPELMQNFLAAPGSQVYEEMKMHRWSYRIFRLRKGG